MMNGAFPAFTLGAPESKRRRKRMKRGIVLVAVVVLSGLISGCGSGDRSTTQLIVGDTQPSSSASKVAERKINIALVMKTLTNPFFLEMERGARKAEKEESLNLIVKTGAKETSIDQQVAIVDELIRTRVDAIVIAPASSVELIPVLRKAQQANIPVINIDNQLDPDVSRQKGLVNVPFISVNNEQGAYLSAKFLCGRITVPTEAAILEGIRTARNAEERKKGALRAFRENPNIKKVSMETANWKIDEAYDVAGRLYSRVPDLQAFFCANDMMAFGVIKYLDEKKRKTVQVAGYDALEEAKKLIREGRLLVTIDQKASHQGYMGIMTALKMIRGESVPAEVVLDVEVVHSGNL
jgi:ribose transport system substrate-binding protein